MNCLITLRGVPGYFRFLWYGVSLTRRRHDVRLHAGPAPAVLPGAGPPGAGTSVGRHLPRPSEGTSPGRTQELLLRAQDLEIELREETSLASFIAGFRLGMGIAGEIEPYSFEDEEEKRAIEIAKSRHPQSQN